MAYTKINSKVCVARIYDRFHVTYSDWVSRTPNWINSAIANIGAYPQLDRADPVVITIVDYKAAIPTDAKLLEAVIYNGVRIPRVDRINTGNTTNLENTSGLIYSYQLDNNGYIYTTFTDEDITLYYRELPVSLDATTGMYFPIIPDNEHLLEAIDFYLITRIVQRGHKVEGYTLNGATRLTNPALAWEHYRKIARSKIQPLDDEELHQISNLMGTFLINTNKYYNDIAYTSE